jgi:Uma2 family endonuclease
MAYNTDMSYPLVRPYITYEELCRLPSDGHRYELFDGEAYVSPSPSLWHQDVLVNLLFAFRAAAEGIARVYIAPADVVLGRATAPQPDLVVVRNEHASIRGVPDLVLEVLSPSTAAMDRGLKMETYARHAIPEYWIVDGDRQAIEVYRFDPTAGSYRSIAAYGCGERATTPLLPALSVDVAQIFTV